LECYLKAISLACFETAMSDMSRYTVTDNLHLWDLGDLCSYKFKDGASEIACYPFVASGVF